MEFPHKEIAVDLNHTALFAQKLAHFLKPGDILSINGDLGSGKTALVKYICESYGITNVSSPTFSIVNEYHGKFKVYHFDFYRIKRIDELYDLGFHDYTNDPEAIIFIEWGNLLSDIVPSNHYELYITLMNDESREFKIIRKF